MSESYFRQRVRRTGGLTLREDLGIAAATLAIALATLDRQTAGEKAIDALGYGLGAAVVWQLARWAVRFLFTVPREMHAEALAERDQARARVAQLEARPPITADHWMALSKEFSAIPDRNVQALWKQSAWSLSGNNSAEVAYMLSLCTRAGAMLLNSPRVAPKLSAAVMAYPEHWHRWLQLVRENGAVMTVVGGNHQQGTYNHLPTVCSRVCIDCGTAEI